MILDWINALNIGGFVRGAADQHHSTHSPHTKKRHKRVPNRERNRRAKQSRDMKRRGGKR